MLHGLGVRLLKENSIEAQNYDGIILVYWQNQKTSDEKLRSAVLNAIQYDQTIKSEVAIIPLPEIGSRMVISPIANLDPDYDDVRSLKDAANAGMKKAFKAGIKKPLIYLQSHPKYPDAELVTLLGVLESCYVPLQVKELKTIMPVSLEHIGLTHEDPNKLDQIISLAYILEAGRRVARDIGEGDPERMAPPRVQEYVEQAFQDSPHIKISVIDNDDEFKSSYPLFEAVNRCASVVDRHRGRIIFLEYNPEGEIKDTLFLVGKGVTYDTGGADIKAGGIMAGMSRDKCGAAAVAGFMKVVAELKPKNVKVVAGLSMVRNSVGSNCYVADELIKARSGVLVRVGNTDAEGRMVMADVLCRMKELAMDAVNPHLFTVATLTGHAHLTVGEGYSIVMENGVARKEGFSTKLQKAGDDMGDPFEISTVRREDFKFHSGKSLGDDVMQCNNAPSSRTARGHQGPAAFLMMASGVDKCSTSHGKPLKFCHLDIAASGGSLPDPCTGAPILALSKLFLLRDL